MALTVLDYPERQLKPSDLKHWHAIPAAIISDELNRLATMDAGIKPLTHDAGVKLVAPAFTVQTMAADNLALHHAVAVAPPGVALVIDAGGYERNAVWGGILHRAAQVRGIEGIIVDGCVRDAAELRRSAVPCFARGVVPAGPHKGWGGTINGPIQVGGCVVRPGDLVVGDGDGVVVIPAERAPSLLGLCQARMAAEEDILRKLDEGHTTVELFGLAPQTG